MATQLRQPAVRTFRPARELLFGTLTVGVLDGLYAVVAWALRGVGPERVFQGVAAGFFGRASFQGGLTTMAVGLATHFFIAFTVVSVYYAASTRIPVLTRRPLVAGMAYGGLVHLFMSFAVIPMSAIGRFPSSLGPFLSGLVAHLFLVGPPAALFARRALGLREAKERRIA